jgi:glycine/D-amino acid oxidase-like deaminating enzyme
VTVCVVGAGFAGLSCAYYLSEKFSVTVMDSVGVGGGASGISAGLLHPYPGGRGVLSRYAYEAMVEARALLEVSEKMMKLPVANYNGIVRLGSFSARGPDIKILGDQKFIIESGITVFSEIYLEGLWKACFARGARLVIHDVQSLEELKMFDRVILAVGSGINRFSFCDYLQLRFVKGQVLVCSLEERLERSVVGGHYTAITSQKNICHVGGTQENKFSTVLPCLQTAINLLKPTKKVLGCFAGIRVKNRLHYFPTAKQLDERTYVITALGSRGLLYHAYLGKALFSQVVG